MAVLCPDFGRASSSQPCWRGAFSRWDYEPAAAAATHGCKRTAASGCDEATSISRSTYSVANAIWIWELGGYGSEPDDVNHDAATAKHIFINDGINATIKC